MPAWTVRTTTPADGSINRYYCRPGAPYNGFNNSIPGNGALYGADVLNNCVGYSVGRCAEITNELTPGTITSAATNPYNLFAPYNADVWYNIAQQNSYQVGQSPAEGAIGVWANGPVGASGTIGHVANIEQIVNGTVYISESHYYYDGNQNVNGSWDYSTLDSNNIPAFIGGDPAWYLVGFIYPPYVVNPPGPGPGPVTRRKLPVWLMTKRLPF